VVDEVDVTFVETVLVVVVWLVVVISLKIVDAASFAGSPVTAILYDPTATLATINDAVIVPPETEQVSEAIAPPPVNEQPVSLSEKPEPEIFTVDPADAEDGLSVMVGKPPLTVNEAEA
jgi:hypothetical protein